jgi:hypothetical protein
MVVTLKNNIRSNDLEKHFLGGTDLLIISHGSLIDFSIASHMRGRLQSEVHLA